MCYSRTSGPADLLGSITEENSFRKVDEASEGDLMCVSLQWPVVSGLYSVDLEPLQTLDCSLLVIAEFVFANYALTDIDKR